MAVKVSEYQTVSYNADKEVTEETRLIQALLELYKVTGGVEVLNKLEETIEKVNGIVLTIYSLAYDFIELASEGEITTEHGSIELANLDNIYREKR